MIIAPLVWVLLAIFMYVSEEKVKGFFILGISILILTFTTLINVIKIIRINNKNVNKKR